jgi:hypothetical protein
MTRLHEEIFNVNLQKESQNVRCERHGENLYEDLCENLYEDLILNVILNL